MEMVHSKLLSSFSIVKCVYSGFYIICWFNLKNCVQCFKLKIGFLFEAARFKYENIYWYWFI